MHHVVLLGDSILDNGSYTRGEPDVITHLRSILPDGWRATLCALDGATTASLRAQLAHVPPDATHLVVSIGGNDALSNTDLLSMSSRSSVAVLNVFAERLTRFDADYRRALEPVLALGRPTTICTIYNGMLEAERADAARLGVALFDDVILRFALTRRLDAIELRHVCAEPQDYANPIEPSGSGGLKIARAIAAAIGAVTSAREPARTWDLG